jgi:hypothetical protein
MPLFSHRDRDAASMNETIGTLRADVGTKNRAATTNVLGCWAPWAAPLMDRKSRCHPEGCHLPRTQVDAAAYVSSAERLFC